MSCVLRYLVYCMTLSRSGQVPHLVFDLFFQKKRKSGGPLFPFQPILGLKYVSSCIRSKVPVIFSWITSFSSDSRSAFSFRA